MVSLNLFQCIGQLGKDPEKRFDQNGNAITTFSVAVNHNYSKDGEKKEDTNWFPIVTWNKVAELCGEYLHKGSKIYVEGRLQNRTWTGLDNQQKTRTEVIAHKVLFLDNRPQQNGVNEVAQNEEQF